MLTSPCSGGIGNDQKAKRGHILKTGIDRQKQMFTSPQKASPAVRSDVPAHASPSSGGVITPAGMKKFMKNRRQVHSGEGTLKEQGVAAVAAVELVRLFISIHTCGVRLYVLCAIRRTGAFVSFYIYAC